MTISINSRFKKAVVAVMLSACAGLAHSAPLPAWDGSLPAAGNPITSQQYQDFTVYSLNYLTNLSSLNSTSGTPFYGLTKPIAYNVDSSPGKLADKVVLVTGNGGQVSNNTDTCGPTGCDNAYNYPSSAATFFRSSTTPDPSIAVPGEPVSSVWTAQASALRSFLKNQDMIFMFNLNEDNGGDANTLDGQSLLVSMRVQLTDAAGKELFAFYIGANNAIGLPQTAAQAWASNGAPQADPTAPDYNPMLTNAGLNGYFSQDPRWAFVHGAISVDATTGQFLAMGDCVFTGLSNCKTINQNLGANDVAFSAFNQRLSDLINDPNSGVAFMNVDMQTSGQSNGFEQLFIMGADIPNRVSEPGALGLIGLALAMVGMTQRRRKSLM